MDDDDDDDDALGAGTKQQFGLTEIQTKFQHLN
jgi:hypothetical protein